MKAATASAKRSASPTLSKTLGKSHACRSLATNVLKLARSRATRFSVAVEALEMHVQALMKKYRTPSKADLERILREVFTSILDDYELSRAARLEDEDVWANLEGAEPVGIPEEDIASYLADHQTPEGRIAAWMRSVQANEYGRIRPIINEALERHGVAFPKDINTYQLFERMMLVVVANAHRIGLERERGTYNMAPYPFPTGEQDVYASTLFDAGKRTLLSEIYPRFLEYKDKEWGAHARKKARVAYKLFLALIGDMPYASIRRQDAARFRDELDQLPAKYAQSPLYRDKTPTECIVVAKQIRKSISEDPSAKTIKIENQSLPRSDAEELIEGLHPKSVNTHLIWLHGFYEWRIKDGYFAGQNPFSGISHSEEREKKATKEEDRRQPWSDEELQKLFAAPTFTGALSRTKRTEKGNVIIEDHHFWAPLISLFSGLREEEILQLWVDDIITEQGVECFYVAAPGPGRKGKSDNAERKVPIHDELKKIGLLEYVAAAKEAGSRFLFPAASRSGPHQSLENYYSKRFGELRRRLGIPAVYDFHSFRHNFSSELEGKHVQNDNIVRYLMGQSRQDMNHVYMKKVDSKTLQGIINQLAPTDVSHLYKGKQKRLRSFTLHKSRTKDHEVYYD